MSNQKALGDSKSIVRGALSIGGFLLASAFGRWAGLSFLLPVVVAAVAYYLLKRVMPPGQATATQLTAVQVGHLAWFLLALFVPGALAQVGSDIVILGGLLIWFGFTQSRKAAYALLAVQILSTAMNIGAIEGAWEVGKLAPLCVHIVFRITAICLIASFLIQGRRQDALPQRETAQANPSQITHNAAAYETPSDTAVQKLVEEADEDEKIIRRARATIAAEREARSADYRAKTHALAADEKKIAKATNFIETSHLSLALPYIQEETRHWPSWSKMDASRWTAPLPLSEVSGSTTGSKEWVQLSLTGGQMYKIEFEASRMPADGNWEYGSITLFVDNEEVLGMFVKRDWSNEWSRWEFSLVESLKIGPWIEGFIDFYNRLRTSNEQKLQDRSNDYVRAKAAKIDLGGRAKP